MTTDVRCMFFSFKYTCYQCGCELIMTSDVSVHEARYSGSTSFRPILDEGKPAIEVSGLSPSIAPNLTVSGTLFPIGVGEATMNVFKSVESITVNANTFTINQSQTIINNPTGFEEVFRQIKSSALENKENVLRNWK